MIPAIFRPRTWLHCGTLCLAAAAVWLLPLSGCFGGTTSEGGNPGITLKFTRDGKPVKYTGYVQIFAKDSNPDFYREPADDGNTSPGVVIGGAKNISHVLITNAPSITFAWDDLALSMYAHAELPLAKRSAAGGSLPDFNIILIGERKDSLAGWLQGVHPDPDGPFRLENGDSGYTFNVVLAKERHYTGLVDTTGPAGRPLALFVPGTPYFAAVHGDRFRFDGIPAGRMPLRWLSANGWVHAMSASLGAAEGSPYIASIPDTLKADARMDSLDLPPAVPTLASPIADPAGQFAFTDSVLVNLTAPSGATIYYTLDGSIPARKSKVYAGPILLRASATLMAVADLAGWNMSPVSVNNYVLVPAAPKAIPNGATFQDSLQVTLSAPAGATIRYTLDGIEPGPGSTLYAGPLTLRASAVLKSVTLLPGLGQSQVAVNVYDLAADSSLEGTLATPLPDTAKPPLP